MLLKIVRSSRIVNNLLDFNRYSFARLKKQPTNPTAQQQSQLIQQSQPTLNNSIPTSNNNYSIRYQQTLLRKLVHSVQQKNKQQADTILNKQFYQNIQNWNNLSKLMQMKNSIDYYFRDFPSLMMNLQNEQKLARNYYDSDIGIIRKMLTLLLSDHKQLQNTIAKYNKKSNKSYFSLYIKSLCGLVLGQFDKSQKTMLQLLNTQFQQLIGQLQQQQQNKNIQQKIQQKLMDTKNPQILNSRQQILFNLLCYKMYKSTQIKSNIKQQQKQKQNRQKLLYKKLKQNKILTSYDLQLGQISNYQNFLNIWVSHKYNTPLQWSDLSQQQKQPYNKYIYLLSQSYYIKKQTNKANRILQQLHHQYPLRQFLEMSQLCDRLQFKRLEQRFVGLQKLVEDNKIWYYKLPQFDIVLVNMLEIMKKAQEKKVKLKLKNNKQTNISNNNNNTTNSQLNNPIKQQKQSVPQQQQQDIQIQQLQYSITILKYNYNITNMDSKGIPFYYLNIPFMDFMVNSQFRKCFI